MAGESETTLIFTYGTLKRGLPNHPLLQTIISTDYAVFLGIFTTQTHFPLVIGPHGIPFLINLPGSGQPVLGELYKVTRRGLGPLDELEGITKGHYERLKVEVVGEGGEVVEAEAYFADKSFGMELWRKGGEVGLGEYTLEMSKGYVGKTGRDPGSCFVDDVWKFIQAQPTTQN